MSEKADGKVVGKRVREAREAKGWTPAQLGAEAGYTAGRVRQIEGGEGVSDSVLAPIATALGRSLAWFRYEVAADVDLAAERAAAYAEGFREALAVVQEVAANLDRRLQPAGLPPAKLSRDPRREGGGQVGGKGVA